MKSVPAANNAFAEIVASSLSNWKAQCWKWDQAPSMGSLVSTTSNNRTLYAIVYAVQTGSDDPMRQPIAYQKTDEQLHQEQPQIFEFLQTICSCLPLGYEENGKFFYHLPPQPPKIHTFVLNPDQEQKSRFLDKDNYLPSLISNATGLATVDELLLGLIREQCTLASWSTDRLQSFFKAYAQSAGTDYRHLRTLIERALSLVKQTQAR